MRAEGAALTGIRRAKAPVPAVVVDINATLRAWPSPVGRTGRFCALGLLTAVIEVCAHALG
jgi:hypothetical protein